MNFNLGSNSLSAFKVGSSNVSKIYKGNNLLYSSFPTYSELGYTRLWCVTDKNGVIDGSASSDSGKYAVKWWDNTTTIHNNNERFAKPHSTLLLHFDGNNADTNTTDSSPYAHAITFNGDAEISTAQSKFGGSSAYFDGNGGSLVSLASGSPFEFGGDFTIETWVRLSSSATFDVIVSATSGGDATAWILLQINQELYFLGSNGSSWVTVLNSGATLSTAQWHHVAVTREGANVRIFVDGVLEGTATSTQSYPSGNTVYVGHYPVINGSTPTTLDGYIDDLHIVKGAALYTSNFTPPTAPASPIIPSGSGTRAFEIYPANKVVSDQSTNNLYGTFEGNVAISSDQSKWGGSSLYQPQSGGSIMIPYHPSLDIGTNDFTIEFWYYPLSLFALGSSIIQGGGFIGDPLGYWCDPVATMTVGINDNGTTFGLGRNCLGFDASAPISLTTNVWHHLAVTREGTTVRFFHNGQFVGSGSSSESYLAQPNYGLRICDPLQATIDYANPYGVSIDGYLDDVRIINGTALYTTETSFTLPSGPLTAISNTVLLLNFDSTSIVPTGQFDGFDVKNNSLLAVRAENVSLSITPGYRGQTGPYWWNWGWIPGSTEDGDLSNNNLSAEALDQFYTDLDTGTGDIFVTNNPGIVGDDPTIATGKGYTVFGSVPPSTVLLLHFDGSNGATSTTDDSPENHSITFNGDAQISTAQSKFGGSSGYCDGVGDWVVAADSDEWDIVHDGDFTIEMWLRFSNNTQQSGIIGQSNGGGSLPKWGLYVNEQFTVGLGNIGVHLGPSGDIIFGAWTPTNNVWHHVAVSRQGDVWRCFVDGVAIGTVTSAARPSQSTGELRIGADGENFRTFTGYIDDVRIIKGHALYTSNFTPPSSQLGVYTWTP